MSNKTHIAMSAGRAIVKKAGVSTHVLMRSFLMGEDLDSLSAAFDVRRAHVEQALRYELALKYAPALAKEMIRNGLKREKPL